MQKKFLSNLILIVVLNLVIKPISIFGIDATVQNKVGAEDYGLYFSLLNFTFLFNILLDLGINNFTTKNVAQHPSLMFKYFGKIAGLRFVLFFLYAAFTILIALALGYPQTVYPVIVILIVQQFLISMIAYFRSYLSGMLMFKWDAFMSVLDRFLLIVLCVTAFIITKESNSFTIETFIWIQFLCYFISFIVGAIIVWKAFGKKNLQVNKAFSLLIMKQSYPYALLIVLMMMYTRIDSVMLERILANGSQQAGIYAQGFRLIDAFFMFAMLFSNLLLPIFSKMIKLGEKVAELFSMASKLLVWGSIALASICLFNAEFILDLIYDNDVLQSVEPFQLMILMFIATCVNLISGTYLTALGEMKTLNWISFLGLMINVIMNWMLIPTLGVVGAALTTLVTQSTVALIQIFIVKYKLALYWSFKDIFTFVTYVGFCFVSTYFMHQFEWHLLLQILMIGGILLLFKVVRLDLLLKSLQASK